MPRSPRVELADAIYHVTTRGNRREPIVADDRDRLRWKLTVAQLLQRYQARLFAYCLMGNHYHLVLHTRLANLSSLMRQINGRYAQAYNRRHGLSGHLFEGRFHAIHVDRERYFLAVCRYVDLNPVRAGLVGDPSEWHWSSWRAHAGVDDVPYWLDTCGLHGRLLGRPIRTTSEAVEAAAQYRDFTRRGLEDRLWERALLHQTYLGDADFARNIKARLGAFDGVRRRPRGAA